MADATLQDFEQMAMAVILTADPILPRPEWGQDAAFVAFVIDELRSRLAEADKLLRRCATGLTTPPSWEQAKFWGKAVPDSLLHEIMMWLGEIDG